MGTAFGPLWLILLLGTQGQPRLGHDSIRREVRPPERVPLPLVSRATPNVIVLDRSQQLAADPESFLFFLFDVSKSFHSLDATTSELLSSLPLLDQTMWSWWTDSPLRTPTQVFVGTIGTGSADQRPLCRFLFAPNPGIFHSPAESAADSAALADSLQTCRARLSDVAPEDYTDIASSLKSAVLNMHSRTRALRGIVIISDLALDPPPARSPAIPDLTESCVGIILRSHSDPAVSADPQEIDRRVRTWRADLVRWGAVDSEYWLAAYTPSGLGRFLQECGRAAAVDGPERRRAKERAAVLIEQDRRTEEARKAEEEAARLAVRQRQEEAARLAEQRRQEEAARRVEEQRQEEAARRAEEQRREEAAQRAAQQRQEEAARLAEQQRREETARLAELERLDAEEEARRLVDAAEAALAVGNTEKAAAAIDTAGDAFARFDGDRVSDSGVLLGTRIVSVRDAIEMRRLEDRVRAGIREADSAQRGGDYRTAIARLMTLRSNAVDGPPSQEAAMLELLDIYLVSKTIDELIQECEAQRRARHSTEPCVPR